MEDCFFKARPLFPLEALQRGNQFRGELRGAPFCSHSKRGASRQSSGRHRDGRDWGFRVA